MLKFMSDKKKNDNPNVGMVYDLVTVNTSRVLALTADIAEVKAKIDMLRWMVTAVTLLVIGVLLRVLLE